MMSDCFSTCVNCLRVLEYLNCVAMIIIHFLGRAVQCELFVQPFASLGIKLGEFVSLNAQNEQYDASAATIRLKSSVFW